jgi:hypothetical protein
VLLGLLREVVGAILPHVAARDLVSISYQSRDDSGGRETRSTAARRSALTTHTRCVNPLGSWRSGRPREVARSYVSVFRTGDEERRAHLTHAFWITAPTGDLQADDFRPVEIQSTSPATVFDGCASRQSARGEDSGTFLAPSFDGIRRCRCARRTHRGRARGSHEASSSGP